MYGARVSVIEMAAQMIPGADPEAAAVLQREFRRKGIDVRLGTRFEELKVDGAGVRVAVSSEKGADELRADQVLVAVGRRARSEGLGLEAAGVALDARGFVKVDARFRTSVPTIAAIGDVAGPPLLAHKASEEGIAAVEFAAGLARPPVDLHHVPACIYAQPQVAWVGLGEAEARARYGDDLRIGRFPFKASGKALAAAHSAGFAKILAEPRYGQIVGAHVVGAGATELVAEIGLALTLEATTSEIAATSHAHPTLSEALLEAALAAEGRSINF
jgi:dihydrolipoamide dehydrogenase